MPTRSFDIEDFSAIRLSAAQDVEVKTGGKPSVKAKGEAAALDRLAVTTTDGTLSITQRGRGRDPVSIKVSVPALRRAAITGSGGLSIDRVKGEAFEGSIAGSGDLSIEAIEVERTRFSIAGSGNVRAAGRAKRSSACIAGSGNANLGELESETAHVSIAGSGNVLAHAAETANVTILGSGNVRIVGGAECEVSRLGSGRVQSG
jgi:hypothetical protein